MIRFILIPLALILLLVVGAALLVPLLVDKDALLALAADALHEQTGATLTVEGDTRLSLFPTLGAKLTEVAITLPEAEQGDLRVRSLEVGVRVLPLLSGDIQVDSIELDGVKLRIDASQQTGSTSVDADDVAAGAGSALAIPAALNVDRLLVTDSHLEWVDASSTTVLELVKLQANHLNLVQQPIPLELQLRRPGEQPMELNVNGAIRLNQQTQQISLDGITAVVSGATPEPAKLQTSGSIDLTQESADLQLKLDLGETHGEGTLRYVSAASPRITAKLHLNQFDPALLALAGPQAGASASSPATTTPSATGEAEPLPLEALRLIDTHAVLDIDQARFGAHPVNNLHADVRGEHGVITLNELRGELHGGALNATATLDATGDTATLNTRGSVDKLDIATALAASNSKPVLAGHASLNWQLSSTGRSSDELVTALLGPVKLTTESVVLQGTSVEQLLCQAVALSNREKLTANFPANTQFTVLTADIQIANGEATMDPLRAELPGIALSGNGRFDLVKEDFTASFKARLSEELEQVDHACRVSKRLLAIDFPVDCAGNVATEPAKWCRVDAAKILQDLTVNEGRGKLEKKASKLLDKLFNRND